jgi:hypothetical protein
MAERGYNETKEMYKLIKRKRDEDNKESGAPNLKENQALIADTALNNYVYFLSMKTALKKVRQKKATADKTKTESDTTIHAEDEPLDVAKAAKEQLRVLLTQLEDTIKRRETQKTPLNDYYVYYVYNFSETLLWAKLHLGFKDFDRAYDDLTTNPKFTDLQCGNVWFGIKA